MFEFIIKALVYFMRLLRRPPLLNMRYMTRMMRLTLSRFKYLSYVILRRKCPDGREWNVFQDSRKICIHTLYITICEARLFYFFFSLEIVKLRGMK